MTVLFSGLRIVAAGVKAESVLAIPADIKKAGAPQTISVKMDATAFPLGITTLSIGISTDNQVTFKTASMTCPGGTLPKGNTWSMEYELGPDDVPTHTKVTVDSSLGFTANMTVEA